MFFKRFGGNYRQLMDQKQMDACFILGNLEKFKWLEASVQWFNTTFPGMVHKCPYKVL